jgi:hypothetical protein
MSYSRVCLICICILSVLNYACSQAGQDSAVQPTPQAEATPEVAKADPDTIIIKGILVNQNGSPASGKSVTIHPIDKKGAPLFVSVFEETEGGGAIPKPWNPKAETDGEGRFELKMPRISRVGDDALKEVALAVDAKPQGGWVAGMVSKLYYVNKDKEEDLCFLKDDASIKLLRVGGNVLKVKVNENAPDTDLGKISLQ